MKNLHLFFTVIMIYLILIIGQSCASDPKDDSTNASNEVKIGSQIWMTMNLNVDHFRNGDPIQEARTSEEWLKSLQSKTPAWCYYSNDPSNGKIYGKLYNCYAVSDFRGLAPEGWHIPTDIEWTVLTDFLGGDQLAGGKMKITGTQFWTSPNTSASNESGFSGLPGGFRNYAGEFFDIQITGRWWSSTEYIPNIIWRRNLYHDRSEIIRIYVPKENGYAVRCIKN